MKLSHHAIVRSKQRGIPNILMDILLEYGTEVNKPGGAIELILTKKNRDELISSIKNVKIPEVSDSDSGEVSDTIPVDFRTLVLAS